MSEKNEWKLVRVNEAFGDLMYWLERCERKGHLENCSDLIEPWEAFDYEYVAAPENTPSAPGDAQDERQAFEAWLARRGVWPALCFEEVFIAGWNARPADAPAAGDALDAARYRWLRDPQTDVALVLDKRTGYVPEDESVPGVGGYHTYEYRAGEELDAAIDAALAAQVPQQGEA